MNERIERLQTEAAKLGVATSGRRDGLYQALGAAAAVGGVVAGLVTYLASLRMDDSRNVLSAIILAVAMLAVSVIGTGVYLRYSLARFLRFWLLRQLYEGQDHVDRVVAAVAGAPADNGAPAEGASLDGDESSAPAVAHD